MLNKFFSRFFSNDSYHQSNISVTSAANRLCNSILGTIYYKFTDYTSAIIKNKVLDPEQNDELHILFPESSAKRNFPQDYRNELRAFHQIQLKNPRTWFTKKKPLCVNDTITALQTPITSPSQLIQMKKTWLHLQEIWGNNFDDVYCVTKIEEGNGTATFNELFTHEYNDEAWKKYLAVQARQDKYNYHSVYKWELKQILRTPEGLKNLILMFGLEYSFIAKTGGKCGGQQAYQSPQFQLNSAINILNDEYCTQALIKIPLIHLAVAKGILPEVSFLLTEDNVNCKSYQGLHYIPNNPTPREEEVRMVLQNTLVILDTPLKIAIDNFDNAALQLLIDHNADTKINVRPGLGLCNARPNSPWDYYVYPSHTIASCQPLVDYFLSKTPKEQLETTAYIEMARSIYNNLPAVEQDAFTEAAEKKMITVDAEGESLTNEPQPLYNFIRIPNTKSARKANETWTHNKATVDNITADMDSYYAKNTLPHTTEDMPYESHINLAGYHAFSALNHLTIEYH